MDNANDFPGRVLASSRGGLEMREVDHTFAGWTYAVGEIRRAAGLDGHRRGGSYGFLDKYFEWMVFGDRRIFLFRHGEPFLVGSVRPSDRPDQYVDWSDIDNQPLANSRWYYRKNVVNRWMPSKPGRVRMETWRRFDGPLNKWLSVVSPVRRRLEDDEFARLAAGGEKERMEAAVNARFENVYHRADASMPLYHEGSTEVRRMLAMNPFVGPNYWRISSEDPDWRVRLALCMNKVFIKREWYYFLHGSDLADDATRGIFSKLAADPEFDVRLAASELLYQENRPASLQAVLDSPYDDDFKIDMAISRMGGGA